MANYCLEGKLQDTKNTVKSSMKCEVTQRLTWDDNSAVFNCNFSSNDISTEDFLFVNSVTIGSQMDANKGWTKYSLNPSKKTGAFFLKGLGINETEYVKSQEVVVYYTDKVWSIEQSYIETKMSLLKLELKAYLGNCK